MKRIIFDVDTQNDILKRKCSKGNGHIVDNIESVLIQALRTEVVLLGSVFAYNKSHMYGYCEVDTTGQEKLNKTIMVDPEYYYNVANTRHGIDINIARDCWQIIFEKQYSNIWDIEAGQPDNLHTFLRSENIKRISIVGCNFNDNIRQTIVGFLKSKYIVEVVVDGIVDIDLESLSNLDVVYTTAENLIKDMNTTYYNGESDD